MPPDLPGLHSRQVQGATAFREATAPHLRAIRELFIDALTPEQIAAAADVAAALREHLTERRSDREHSRR
jgi:ribosomal protein S15P/S13E